MMTKYDNFKTIKGILVNKDKKYKNNRNHLISPEFVKLRKPEE